MSINRILADNEHDIFEDYPPLNNQKLFEQLNDNH